MFYYTAYRGIMFDLKLLFYCFFYTNFKAPNDILDDKTKAFIKTYKSNTAVLDTITKKVVEEYCKQDVPEINKLLRNNITPNGKNRTILEKLDYLTSKSIDRNIIVFNMTAEMLSGEPEPAVWVLPKTSLNATVPFLLFSYWQIILPLLRRGGSPFPTAQEYHYKQ